MLSIFGVIGSIAEGGRENPKYASYTDWPPDYLGLPFTGVLLQGQDKVA